MKLTIEIDVPIREIPPFDQAEYFRRPPKDLEEALQYWVSTAPDAYNLYWVERAAADAARAAYLDAMACGRSHPVAGGLS